MANEKWDALMQSKMHQESAIRELKMEIGSLTEQNHSSELLIQQLRDCFGFAHVLLLINGCWVSTLFSRSSHMHRWFVQFNWLSILAGDCRAQLYGLTVSVQDGADRRWSARVQCKMVLIDGGRRGGRKRRWRLIWWLTIKVGASSWADLTSGRMGGETTLMY